MKKFEFSKIIVALTILIVYPSIVFLSYQVIALARLAILNAYIGELPYLVALITPCWAAFATIIGFYFNKAKAENQAKITKTNNNTKITNRMNRDY